MFNSQWNEIKSILIYWCFLWCRIIRCFFTRNREIVWVEQTSRLLLLWWLEMLWCEIHVDCGILLLLLLWLLIWISHLLLLNHLLWINSCSPCVALISIWILRVLNVWRKCLLLLIQIMIILQITSLLWLNQTKWRICVITAISVLLLLILSLVSIIWILTTYQIDRLLWRA